LQSVVVIIPTRHDFLRSLHTLSGVSFNFLSTATTLPCTSILSGST
jgi:hypothetical protein